MKGELIIYDNGLWVWAKLYGQTIKKEWSSVNDAYNELKKKMVR